METTWIPDSAHLWHLYQANPDRGARRLSRFTERSLTWGKKWLRRFRQADPGDEDVLHSHSRARRTSPRKVCKTVTDERLVGVYSK